jgi:hypothetical protein
MPFATVADVILQVERLRATVNVVEALYVRGKDPSETLTTDQQEDVAAYFEVPEREPKSPWTGDDC